MFQLSSLEVAALTLQIERRIAQNSFILVSHLRADSSLLRSRKSAIDALRTFGIESESDLTVLAVIPQDRCVVVKASDNAGGAETTAKMKLFLDAYYCASNIINTDNNSKNSNTENQATTTTAAVNNGSCAKVSWISEDFMQSILERHNLSTSGKPL